MKNPKENKFARLCRQILEHLAHCDEFGKEEEEIMRLAKELLITVAKAEAE
jgi:hypothetical protein